MNGSIGYILKENRQTTFSIYKKALDPSIMLFCRFSVNCDCACLFNSYAVGLFITTLNVGVEMALGFYSALSS